MCFWVATATPFTVGSSIPGMDPFTMPIHRYWVATIRPIPIRAMCALAVVISPGGPHTRRRIAIALGWGNGLAANTAVISPAGPHAQLIAMISPAGPHAQCGFHSPLVRALGQGPLAHASPAGPLLFCSLAPTEGKAIEREGAMCCRLAPTGRTPAPTGVLPAHHLKGGRRLAHRGATRRMGGGTAIGLALARRRASSTRTFREVRFLGWRARQSTAAVVVHLPLPVIRLKPALVTKRLRTNQP